ncbi:MAG: TonB-dependent receptor, partial [Bacteroidota bacterium]
DPLLAEKYTFSGSLMIDNPQECVPKLFANIPLDYEFKENKILVIPTDVQSFTVCGKVLSALDQSPLAFANVYVEGTARGVQTDELGRFELNYTALKNQPISISYVGFKSKSFPIGKWADKDCHDILLEIDSELFGKEIVIRDYLLSGVEEGEDHGSIKMNYDLILDQLAANEHDVLKTVQLVPGVTAIDETAINLNIRGATPDQNLILWEGATLYDPGHLFGMVSSINPYVVDQVDIYKGVYNPKYDNRIGGIVDISLQDQHTPQFKGGFGSTLTEAHAFLSIPVWKDKLSFVLSGRNTINGLVRSPTLRSYFNKAFQDTKVEEEQEEIKEGYREADQTLKYSDWNGKVIFTPYEWIDVKVSYFSSSNQFNYFSLLFEDDLESEDIVTNSSSAFSSNVDLNWNSKHSTQLEYVFSYYDNDYFYYQFFNPDSLLIFSASTFNDIYDYRFGATHKIKSDDNMDFELGYAYDRKEVSFFFGETSAFEQDFEEEGVVKGSFHNLFGSFNLTGDNYQVNAGMKLTNYVEANTWLMSPRLSFHYLPLDNLKMKLSFGRLYQFISQLQEFGDNELNTSSNLWVLNDAEDDSFLSANKLSAGFVFNQKGWTIDVEAYTIETEGLASYSTNLNRQLDIEDNGSSTSMGIDLLINKRWRNYQFWLNYSFSNSTFFFEQVSDDKFPSTFDQRHRLSFVNNWTVDKFTISMTYQYKTGLPFSQPLNTVERVEDDDGFYYALDYPQINGSRLNNYHRLDLGVSYKTKLRNKLNAEFSFTLINLLNRENELSRDYFIGDLDDDETPDVFLVDKRLLEVTPLLLTRFYW